eukprot:GHVT01017775.1.p1 GENE.GHVT01017775.1~~GHVT01017775.1.p1  ORF type:complete len:130 (+),score=9.70 GHVT01017775.1:147-536(+)
MDQAPFDIEGEVYSDPDRSLHKLFHLKRGVFRTLATSVSSGAKAYGFKGLVEAFKFSKETVHLAGDYWQQGGTLLLDRDANVLYQHKESNPTDWPEMEHFLNIIGATGSVDYKAATKQWLKMRDEQKHK